MLRKLRNWKKYLKGNCDNHHKVIITASVMFHAVLPICDFLQLFQANTRAVP